MLPTRVEEVKYLNVEWQWGIYVSDQLDEDGEVERTYVKYVCSNRIVWLSTDKWNGKVEFNPLKKELITRFLCLWIDETAMYSWMAGSRDDGMKDYSCVAELPGIAWYPPYRE